MFRNPGFVLQSRREKVPGLDIALPALQGNGCAGDHQRNAKDVDPEGIEEFEAGSADNNQRQGRPPVGQKSPFVGQDGAVNGQIIIERKRLSAKSAVG